MEQKKLAVIAIVALIAVTSAIAAVSIPVTTVSGIALDADGYPLEWAR